MLPPHPSLYGIRWGRFWPRRSRGRGKIDPDSTHQFGCRETTQTLIENVLLGAVRLLAVLFLFIATTGIMLIYGIIAGGLYLAGRAGGRGTKSTAIRNRDRRAERHDD